MVGENFYVEFDMSLGGVGFIEKDNEGGFL